MAGRKKGKAEASTAGNSHYVQKRVYKVRLNANVLEIVSGCTEWKTEFVDSKSAI
jgi:hypothetical protein